MKILSKDKGDPLGRRDIPRISMILDNSGCSFAIAIITIYKDAGVIKENKRPNS